MDSRFYIDTGTPFTGQKLEKMISFLRAQGLDYDNAVLYSVMVMHGEKVIACGSCAANVLKCIAVDPLYRGDVPLLFRT